MSGSVTRRKALGVGLGGMGLAAGGAGLWHVLRGSPPVAAAQAPRPRPRPVTWDDLIPPGVPYSEIIGEGDMDFLADRWKPIYDANATKFNPVLEGAFIRMPGYVIPMAFDGAKVTEFILVPYQGACIHVPPPPPNQLVYVKAPMAWQFTALWDAIWVTGTMRTQMLDTDIAVIGYELTATDIDAWSW